MKTAKRGWRIQAIYRIVFLGVLGCAIGPLRGQIAIPNPDIPAPGINTNLSSLPDWSVLPSLPGILSLPTVPATPSPSISFQALSDDLSRIPPDTMGAVGTNYVVTMLNSQVRVSSRSGTTIQTTNLDGFWALTNSSSTNFTYDPRILYDPYNSRWIASAGVDAALPTAGIMIGVSATSDPTGTWYRWRVKADSSSVLYADQPKIGFNKNWIVVQGNMFYNTGPWSTKSQFWIFNKTNLYANNYVAPTFRYSITSAGSEMPPIVCDNTTSFMEVIQNAGGFSAGASGALTLYLISGSFGSETFAGVNSYPSSGPVWADNAPSDEDFGPQLGATVKMDLGDGKINSSVYRNGYIWCAQTVFLPESSPTHSAIQWWQMDGNGISQRGLIEDTTAVTNYAYPSIAVNRFNDLLIGFSSFSTNQYASAAYAFHAYSDALDSMRPIVVLKAGQGPYWKTFGSGQNRWGDYSATVVDPINDIDFWTIQEYAATNTGSGDGSGNWGTWWGNIQMTIPSNDAFSAAISLGGGQGSTNGTNVRATKESGEPNHGGNAGGASVWYEWTAPSNGNVSFTNSSSFPGYMAAYTGSTVGSLTAITNDAARGDMTFNATSGITYHIAIDGKGDGTNANMGAFILLWDQPSAPLFTIQPQTQYVIASNSVTFTSMAIGVPTPTYQWLFNSNNISGATSANYTISVPLTNNSGFYSVVASNSGGSVTSQVASLTVYNYATSTLGTMNYSTNNVITFTLTGASGVLYQIQQSTNLINWTTILTNAASFTFTNNVPTNVPYNFFRGVYN